MNCPATGWTICRGTQNELSSHWLDNSNQPATALRHNALRRLGCVREQRVREVFDPSASGVDRGMQLLLEQFPRRQLGYVLGDANAALLQLQQFHVLLRLPGTEDQPERRVFTGARL